MKKYFILAAAAAMFAACSNNEDLAQGETPTERIPLTIGAAFEINNSDVTSTMRGVYTKLQKDSISLSNTVGLFIVKQGKTSGTNTATVLGSESYEVKNQKLTAPTTAGTYFTDTEIYGNLSSGSTTLYYPDDKAMQIGLFAYAPHTTDPAGTTSFTTTPVSGTNLNTNLLTVTPATNQTANDKYIASDILWGTQGYNTTTYDITAQNYLDVKSGTAKDGFSSDANAKGYIKLPMKHALTKVTVNLYTSGMDLSKLQGATVKMYVDYPTGTMNLATGAITLGTKSPQTAVTLTSHLGMTMGTGGTAITSGDGFNTITISAQSHDCYQASAVILPQEVLDGESEEKKFIEITLADGSTVYTYKAKDVNMTTAAAEYTYNIKVSASGLQVTASVTDWTSGGTATEGDATLQ